MISLSLVASQSVYTPKWSSAILKTNSLPTNCCLGKEPFRGNYRCTDWWERLLIIFQLARVSGCVCVRSFLNAFTFPLLWLWFPGVSVFLASSLLFMRDHDCGWVFWPHPEAFCWKQSILSIKFRSLGMSGGCEWEWPWFAHSAVWKANFEWETDESWKATERRSIGDCLSCVRKTEAWEAGSWRSFTLAALHLRWKTLLPPKGMFWGKTCGGDSRNWNTRKVLSYVI